MTAAALLERLEAVRPRGQGQWMAKCPAHEDRSPSLSIREASDGTTLIKCFGGCGAADVLESVGLEFKDLFPNDGEHRKPTRRHQRPGISTRDLVNIISHECLVVCIIAGDLARGEARAEDVSERLLQAVEKVETTFAEVRNG